MNANRKTAVILGGVVLLSAAIATVIFLLSGSQGVIYFAMVGIPLLVVAGVGAYVKGVVAQSGKSEEQFVTKRARSVAQEYQDVLRQVNEYQSKYPDWNPGIEAQIKSIAGDFENQGVVFDLESGSFNIGDNVGSSDIQEFERLSGEVESLRDDVTNNFTTFASSQLSEFRNVVGKLQDVNLVQTSSTIITNPGNSLSEAADNVDKARNTCENSINEAIETVRNMGRGETRAEDLDLVNEELDNAKSFASQSQYDASLNAVLEARDRLRDQFSGSFDKKKDAIEKLVEAINQSNVEKYVDPDSIDEIKEVEDTIRNLNSALDLSDLAQTENRARRVAEDMVATIEHNLDKETMTLEQADLPSGYYTKPDALEERYLSQLEQCDSMEEFTQIWIEASEGLTEALQIAQTKSSVVDAYEDVEETIRNKLHSEGKVTTQDLPMKNADQFLGLYYRYEEGVELVQDGTVLRRGDVETYSITIDISYDKGSEDPRTATVELDGAGYNKSKSLSTRIAGSLMFEEVPGGEITIKADPGDHEFGSIEREMSVTSEDKIELDFSERGLAEQLCEDIEADLEGVLSDMESKFEDLYSDNGYLSTEMDLPIQDSYQPCLFAMWSEETGKAICRDGDEILVYNGNQLTDELEKVLQYNAEPGELLEFDQIRRNFLSAPLPDSVIQSELMAIDNEYNLDPVADGVEVN